MSPWDLASLVRVTALDVHRYLGPGHLEKVYENALSNRLRRCCEEVRQQAAIPVLDEDGTLLGDYFADVVIGGIMILELKAVRCLAPEHFAQIIGYLRSTGLEHGMLVNFGAPRLEIRKLVLSRNRPAESAIG